MDIDFSTYAQLSGFSYMPTPEEYYPEVSTINVFLYVIRQICWNMYLDERRNAATAVRRFWSGIQTDAQSSASSSTCPRSIPSEDYNGHVRWLQSRSLSSSSPSMHQCLFISLHDAGTKTSQGNDVPQRAIVS